MLSAEIKIIDLDARHWVNLLELFARPKDREPKSLLLLAVQGDRAVKAWHSQKGALPGFAYAEGDDLEKVRLAAEADRVGVFPADLFARTFAAWQRAIVHDDDWDRQITAIAETVRPMLRREIRWHPGPPWRLPEKSTLPSLERRAKRLWPDGTCVGFFVMEGRTPYTSLIIGKNGGKITLMTSLDAFGLADGPLDGATGAKTVADLCRERFQPLHAAVWIERGSWSELRAGPHALKYFHLACRRGRAAIRPFPWSWRVALFAARLLGKA